MKENPRRSGATDPTKIRNSSLRAQNKSVAPAHLEAANLSPEKIQEKVSAPSKVLIHILEGEAAIHFTRHWGINE